MAHNRALAPVFKTGFSGFQGPYVFPPPPFVPSGTGGGLRTLVPSKKSGWDGANGMAALGAGVAGGVMETSSPGDVAGVEPVTRALCCMQYSQILMIFILVHAVSEFQGLYMVCRSLDTQPITVAFCHAESSWLFLTTSLERK